MGTVNGRVGHDKGSGISMWDRSQKATKELGRPGEDSA